MDTHLLRIGAERRHSGEAEVIRSPFDDRPVAEVCVAGRSDMEDAIERAVAGFEAMRRLPTHRRTKDSRFGREGVQFAMQEMTEPKVLVMRGVG